MGAVAIGAPIWAAVRRRAACRPGARLSERRSRRSRARVPASAHCAFHSVCCALQDQPPVRSGYAVGCGGSAKLPQAQRADLRCFCQPSQPESTNAERSGL